MRLALPLAVFSALALATAAPAQTRPAAERLRDANALPPAHFRSFLVIPHLDLEHAWDDNIYATTANRVGDRIATLRPQLALQSDWNRHALNLLARGEFNRFGRHAAENTDNATLAADGRLDILHDTALGGGLAWFRNHEDRGDPESPANALHPVRYDLTVGRLGAYRARGLFNARFDSEIRHYAYQNAATASGLLIDEAQRNRFDYLQTLRLGYQPAPGRETYLKGVIDSRVYGRKTLDRSSHGQSAGGGLVLDLTGKTYMDAFAGLAKRHYLPPLADVITPIYALQLTWNPSEPATLLAHVTRNIEETTQGASSAYVLGTYGLELQQAFTRRWVAALGLDYAHYGYRGTAVDQEHDALWTARLSSAYYLGHNWKAGAEYLFRTRASNLAGGDYARGIAMLTLTMVF
jgi:hypothetical protein